MSTLVADTHSILWFLLASSQLSSGASRAMSDAILAGDSIVVAAITLVELAYLVEKGRVPAHAFDLVAQGVANPASGLVLAPLDLPVAGAVRLVPRVFVPDMPDRIITATAMQLGLPLVTADRQIRASGVTATIW
jgi:PIN domain nuclease of toxin-antitoxin system